MSPPHEWQARHGREACKDFFCRLCPKISRSMAGRAGRHARILVGPWLTWAGFHGLPNKFPLVIPKWSSPHHVIWPSSLIATCVVSGGILGQSGAPIQAACRSCGTGLNWDRTSSLLLFRCLLLIKASLCIPFASLCTIMFPIIIFMFKGGVANEIIPTPLSRGN